MNTSRIEKNKLILAGVSEIHKTTTPEERKEMLAAIKTSHAHMSKAFHEFWELVLTSDLSAEMPA